jgi:hypothetical protein
MVKVGAGRAACLLAGRVITQFAQLQVNLNLLNVGLPAAGFADSDSEAKRGMRVPVLEVNHDEGARSKNFKKCKPSSSTQARCARRLHAPSRSLRRPLRTDGNDHHDGMGRRGGFKLPLAVAAAVPQW